MSIPLLTVFIAALLIYVPRAFVLHAQVQKGLDNRTPRLQQAALTGLGARAQGAHMNGFEAFAPFAAGVLGCLVHGVHEASIVPFALGFVVLRTIYIGLYLANIAPARSLVWGLGVACSAVLLVKAFLPLATTI